MFRFKHRLGLLLAGLFLFWGAQSWAAAGVGAKPFAAKPFAGKPCDGKAASPFTFAEQKYTRLSLLPGTSGDPEFQTAVWTFRSATDPDTQVDLFSVIHVGEKGYYKQINKMLDDYDVVLYEMITDTKGEKPGKKTAYTKLAAVMGLVPQVEHINYERGHFVHADMTKSELLEALRRHGLPYEEPDDTGAAEALKIFRPLELRMLVTLFMMARDDKKAKPEDAVIIHERNQVALNVLAKTLAKGHKKIAIFYGAGHMLDFERELVERFDMVPVAGRWLTAWTLPDPKKDGMQDGIQQWTPPSQPLAFAPLAAKVGPVLANLMGLTAGLRGGLDPVQWRIDPYVGRE